MKLTSVLNRNCILYDLAGRDRRSLYMPLATRIIREAHLELEPGLLVDEMIAREDSMRIPYEGVALPHLRRGEFHGLYAGIGVLREPAVLTEYDARPTGIIVMTLVSDDESDTYLMMLAAFARYFSEPGNIEKLIKCRTPQALLACLDHDRVRLEEETAAGAMTEKIKIKALSPAERNAVAALFQDAGWWDESYGNGDFIPRIIRRSTVFLGAFAGGRLIGMGRAISDGVSDAYIQDVAVLKEMRGRGVGRRIVEEIIRRLRRRGIDWIGLVSTPGSEGFYESMGFEIMERHSPMLLGREE